VTLLMVVGVVVACAGTAPVLADQKDRAAAILDATALPVTAQVGQADARTRTYTSEEGADELLSFFRDSLAVAGWMERSGTRVSPNSGGSTQSPEENSTDSGDDSSGSGTVSSDGVSTPGDNQRINGPVRASWKRDGAVLQLTIHEARNGAATSTQQPMQSDFRLTVKASRQQKRTH
jgi:hypothetical protein